jgi:hypothetical protein
MAVNYHCKKLYISLGPGGKLTAHPTKKVNKAEELNSKLYYL